MSPSRLCFLVSFLATLLAVPYPTAAFESPLSDTAVREAYFMGQRRDNTMERFFDRYTKHLPPPKAGLNISSVAFLTPFALVAERSFGAGNGYSAQQAEADHRNSDEVVSVVVQVYYTDLYSSTRPPGFWQDFDVCVADGENLLKPLNSKAEPLYVCSSDGGCTTIGAKFRYDFDPESFTADTAVVNIKPPDGDLVTVQFDLDEFR
jgi:hypothetical protein